MLKRLFQYGRQLSPADGELAPRGIDLWMLAAIVALVSLGIVMVYSGSAVFAGARYKDGEFFLRRQLVYAALGCLALYVGARLDYGIYQRFTYPMLLASALSLCALLIPGLGTRVDGAVRWFRLGGISFQPSEPAKFSLLVYLSYSLAKKRHTMSSFSIGVLPHLLVAGLMALMVLLQPDLGTSAVMIAVTLILLLVAGARLTYVVIALLAGFPLAYQQIVGTPWRMRRLLAFLDPWSYRRSAGYQISESLISIGSGGLRGLGLGEGRQKLFFLPAAHTDFVFAIIGEELGFTGLAAVVGLFLLLVLRTLRASFAARDLFGGYLAFGCAALIAVQALLHMAVVTGLAPTKGITLPFVSYGGTALITMMFISGVALNISGRYPRPAPVSRRRLPDGNRRRPQRVVVAGAEGHSEAV
ncbi:MAG: putative lipid II flippase FtsW [Deltaproteobacteria bacterium]|nr:putative lipid II flippase FtsW [Deltaproteobacteria bacterium]